MRLLVLVITTALAIPLIPGICLSDDYVRPSLLVEPDQLAETEAHAPFVILDVRKAEDFAQGHIPGARLVDHDEWKAAFSDGSDVKAWSERIGGIGIDQNTKVVLYDASASKNAARIWWVLRYWGIRDARLLNGGWKAWQAAGLAIDDSQPASPPKVDFVAEPDIARSVSKDQLRDVLKDDRRQLQIIDARSSDEYCGIDLKENLRGGAIPGALHLDWKYLIEPETDRFKSPAKLRALFKQAGIDLGKPTASHCQSGGRASVMVFALELMGAEQAGNYYPGWSEWGNVDGLPISQPKQD